MTPSEINPARKKEALPELKGKVEKLGVGAEAVTCDLTNPKSIESLAQKIGKKHLLLYLYYKVQLY